MMNKAGTILECAGQARPWQPAFGIGDGVVVLAIEFRLLGPVEASIDGRLLDVGHARQQCVLAALLLDANRTASVDQLLDRVWGDRPPQRARESLQSYMSRLRKVLAPVADVGIARRPDGYVLAVDPAAIDVSRFRGLVRVSAESDDDEDTAALLGQALALWKGDALGALDTPWLNAARDGLNAERLVAELNRNDVSLRLGRHAELIGPLSAQAVAHPWDERIAGQMMLALYRCGRQADALEAYQQLRERLADELGTDPSPPLRRLHQQILTADPELAAPPAATSPLSGRRRSSRPPSGAAAAPVPRQLPAPPGPFSGRVAELARLDTILGTPVGDAPVIATISGGGGMGKTWVALQWAATHADRYPDGQLYVDMRGFDPSGEPVGPETVLRGFLEGLGVDPMRIPADLQAQASLYRSLIADRRMLVVLDNVRDSGPVVPLLPGTRTSAVLVTSRRQLARLVVNHGACPLALDVMPDDDAHDIMVRQVGRTLTAEDQRAMDSLVAQCAGLPLALAIVASRAALQPERPLTALAAEMRATSTRLDALDAGELAVNLRAVLACSRQALTQQTAQVFDLLGLASSPDICLAAAASLTALPVPQARTVLGGLIAANLLQENAPGRYQMHDLVWLYAVECAGGHEEGQQGAVRRLLDHYLHTAHGAALLLSPHRQPLQLTEPSSGTVIEALPDLDAAMEWFSREHEALIAATDQALDLDFCVHAHQLPWTMAAYLDRRGLWRDWIRAQRIAVEAAERLADRQAQAQAQRLLANAYSVSRRFDDALTHLRRALDLFDADENDAGRAHVHFDIALQFDRQGQNHEALQHARQSLTYYRAVPHPQGEAVALNAVGWYHCQLGEYREGLKFCLQALALANDIGSPYGQSNALDSLGFAHFHLGEYQEAIDCYRRALDHFHAIGDRHNGATALDHLGDAYLAAGDLLKARDAWQESFDVFDELDHTDADRVRAKLAEVPQDPESGGYRSP